MKVLDEQDIQKAASFNILNVEQNNSVVMSDYSDAKNLKIKNKDNHLFQAKIDNFKTQLILQGFSQSVVNLELKNLTGSFKFIFDDKTGRRNTSSITFKPKNGSLDINFKKDTESYNIQVLSKSKDLTVEIISASEKKFDEFELTNLLDTNSNLHFIVKSDDHRVHKFRYLEINKMNLSKRSETNLILVKNSIVRNSRLGYKFYELDNSEECSNIILKQCLIDDKSFKINTFDKRISVLQTNQILEINEVENDAKIEFKSEKLKKIVLKNLKNYPNFSFMDSFHKIDFLNCKIHRLIFDRSSNSSSSPTKIYSFFSQNSEFKYISLTGLEDSEIRTMKFNDCEFKTAPKLGYFKVAENLDFDQCTFKGRSEDDQHQYQNLKKTSTEVGKKSEELLFSNLERSSRLYNRDFKNIKLVNILEVYTLKFFDLIMDKFFDFGRSIISPILFILLLAMIYILYILYFTQPDEILIELNASDYLYNSKNKALAIIFFNLLFSPLTLILTKYLKIKSIKVSFVFITIIFQVIITWVWILWGINIKRNFKIN